MKRGYVETQYGQMHYAEAGQGASLVMLHPAPKSSRAFAQVQPLLARHFRCIALDQHGFGNSDPAPDGVRFEELARTVTQAMDALGVAKAHVYGVHTGFHIATALAVAFPDRVDRLVASGMTHSLVVDQKVRNAAVHAVVANFKRFDETADEGELMRQWATFFTTLTGTWWDTRVMGFRHTGIRRFQHLESRAMDLLQCRLGMFGSVQAVYAHDIEQKLLAMTQPALVIEIATPQEAHFGRQGPEWMKRLKRGEFYTTETLDPHLMAQDIDELAEVITRFLTKPL